MLSRRGIVKGEVGRGTFVLPPQPSQKQAAMIELSFNTIPQAIEPDVLAIAANRAARKCVLAPNGGYGDIAGWPSQRAALARWLGRSRLETDPDALIATVGAQHAIGLAFADLAAFGGALATEPATFTGAIAAARNHGLKLIAVPVDEQGMRPDGLDRVLRDGNVGAIYTTPIAHNPLGFETGEQRKFDILKLCRKYDVFIVEDEVYANYGTAETVPYKKLDPDIVYYVNSLSKSLSPLLRVGVLVPPPTRRSSILEFMRGELWAASPLAIEVASELIEAGTDVEASRWLREEARARNEQAAGFLGRDFVREGSACPHTWIPMPLHVAEKVARRAAQRGVRVTPPSAPLLDPDQVSGLRLCLLAPPSRDELRMGLLSLSGILSEPEEPIV
jgi:DNA-binding transcriptional MocR family regulator